MHHASMVRTTVKDQLNASLQERLAGSPLIPLQPTRFRPRRYLLGPWFGHLFFARDLIAAVAPSLIVELGTHFGESYFGFCQAVQEQGSACQCFAIDTWHGDPHTGFYSESIFNEVRTHNEEWYAQFSTLLRTTFDEATTCFSDASIDILHIDGYHTYDAVRRDFETWSNKVRPGGIVLFHDTAIRQGDFGVWRFWEEIRSDFRTFSFLHSCGLGVLQIPGGPANAFIDLLLGDSEADRTFLSAYYANLATLAKLEHTIVNAASPGQRECLAVFPNLRGTHIESESIQSPFVPGEWAHHVVTLPAGSPAGPIRIDPSAFPCLVEIGSVSLRKAGDSEALTSWSGQELHALQCSGQLRRVPGTAAVFISFGDDPQLILPDLRDITTQPLVLEIWARMTRELDAALRVVANEEKSSAVGSAAELEQARALIDQLSAENRSRISEVDGLKNDLAILGASRDSLKTENEALCGQLNELRADLQRVTAERDFFSDQARQIGSLLENDRGVLSARIAELTGICDQLMQERENVIRLRSELHTAEEKLQACTGSLLNHQREIADLKTSLLARVQAAQTEADAQLHLKEDAQSRLADTVARFEAERRSWAEALESERGERTDLLNSVSWRITSPLRRIYEMVTGR
jgi:hypothetical protein